MGERREQMDCGGAEGFKGMELSNPGFTIPIVGSDPQNQNALHSGASYNNPNAVVREYGNFVPIDNIIYYFKRVIPSHVQISDEVKEIIQECISMFINFITIKANEHFQENHHEKITDEDILWVLSNFGFDNYLNQLSLNLRRYHDAEDDQCRVIRNENIMVKQSLQPPTEYGIIIYDDKTSLPLLPPMSPQLFNMDLSGSHHDMYNDGVGGFFFGMSSGGLCGNGVDNDESMGSISI